ncbi:hypothetical protein [Lysobacter antibioticus]|uniref:Uncharacterized protein n=1 Tax=Lysobacter antibioticus TaxID=84531 RepID=A0A0S2FCP7_LYSAN|nr:hypothetical protein [Lysobacter antibioticus]ALN81296.1 hypothetical protein LA76x_3168 [Lysobacter antibioticus]
MERLTPPAVPGQLRELLQDYPAHVEQLQDALNEFAVPKLRLQPFEDALMVLEIVLDGFVHEATNELDAAEASGDADRIEKANEKRRLMFRARSSNVGLGGKSLQELWEYFQRNKGVFE